MALNKEITKESGLTTKYHRIAGVAINYNQNQSIITVEDYISEDYRNKAKKIIEVKQQISDLFVKLENADNDELVLALTNKIQQTQIANAELLNKNYAVSTKDICLDYIPESTTYVGFYEELKKLEEYKDADFI